MQCIIFDDLNKYENEWMTIIELFSREIYCNNYYFTWFNNKINDLIEKIDLDDIEVLRMRNLIEDYLNNEEYYKDKLQYSIPLAERVIKYHDEYKLISETKFNYLQRIFYKKEFGEGLIKRKEYDEAITYHVKMLTEKSLNYKYHAYKQLGRIFIEMDDINEFKRIYEESLLKNGLNLN